MDHLPAKSFWQDYRDLLEDIKKKARKSFRLFKAVPRHTSFHTHKILDANNPVIFEGYIDKSYRFTFHYEADAIVYNSIGKHKIIDQESRR